MKGGSVLFWQNVILGATSAVVVADFLYNVGFKKNELETINRDLKELLSIQTKKNSFKQKDNELFIYIKQLVEIYKQEYNSLDNNLKELRTTYEEELRTTYEEELRTLEQTPIINRSYQSTSSRNRELSAKDRYENDKKKIWLQILNI